MRIHVTLFPCHYVTGVIITHALNRSIIMDIITASKFTKDADPISSTHVDKISGGKVVNATFFPNTEWRKGQPSDPVSGSLFLEILGANINGTECDVVFCRPFTRATPLSVPSIPGAEKLRWDARPVEGDGKYAAFTVADGKLTFSGNDNARGLVLGLNLGGKTLEFTDVNLSQQVDAESKLPIYSRFQDKRTGQVIERPVLWAHPKAVAAVSQDAEFGDAVVEGFGVGEVRQAAARRTPVTVTE